MSDLQQSYSDLAAEYNRRRFEGTSGRFVFETDKAIIRDFLAQTGARRIIDAPVGTGRTLEYLGDLDIEVVGVDLTEEMLSVARQVAHPTRHTVQQGDASKLPFADGEFDALVSLRFFHLFPPARRVPFVREFIRVVKPGGYLIVNFTNGWFGGGIGWGKRLLGRQTQEFEHPGEVRQLFKGCEILARRGNFLPKHRALVTVPGLGSLVKASTAHAPVNLICFERFYLIRTPSR